MGDENDAGALFLLQFVHQPQNLGLDGHIQGGGGLVRNQNFGAAGQRHGNHHPLAHAAGKLVRILPDYGLGIGNLHVGKHFQRQLVRFLFGFALMDDERLA